MPFCEASMPQGLSPTQKLEVIGTYMYSKCSTTALALASSKRKRDELDNDREQETETSISKSEDSPSSRRLRKRAKVSYVEPTESDIESAADSGYNSDSSIEWSSRGSRHSSKPPKAKRPHKEKPVKPFPFLSLPAELRNKIYLLALEEPDGMVLQEGWRAHRRVPKRGQFYLYHNKGRYDGLANLVHPDPLPDSSALRVDHDLCTLSPSLLAVNKQIYAEAVQVLYSQPLHFINTAALHSFLGPLSKQTLYLIRSITIHKYETWGRGIRKAMNVSALTLFRGCDNLQLLRIERFEHYYHNSNVSAEESGNRQGALMARQIYRDAAFWLDTIGASKALQVLHLTRLRREILRERYWNQQAYDDKVETLKFLNIAFAEELTLLVRGMGKVTRRSRRSKATVASNTIQAST